VLEHVAHLFPLVIVLQLYKALPAQFRREYLGRKNPQINQFQYFGQRLLIGLALEHKLESNHFLDLLSHLPPELLNRIHNQCRLHSLIKGRHQIVQVVHIIDRHINVCYAVYEYDICCVRVRYLD
jgi:hypothetical protein